MFPFILTLIGFCSTQTIEITDLTNNPGLLAIHMGEGRTSTDNYRLLHVLNLDKYKDSIDQIKQSITELETFKNDSFTTIINLKFKHLQDTFQTIYPRKISKRYLLNLLGTGIKFITGNMDQEDATRINNEIDTIKLNNRNLIEQNNKQVEINSKIINKFNNLTEKINDQQTEIQNFFSKAKNTISNSEKNIKVIQYISQLSYNIEVMQISLNTISETIQLSKLNVISKHILGNDELEFGFKVLNEQNIKINSLEQVYEFCSIQAFYNNSNIIFVISIPKFHKNPFKLLLLEPLPIHSQSLKILKIPYSYALVKGDETYFMASECSKIEKYYICNEDKLLNYTLDGCYHNILRGDEGKCTFTDFENSTEIKQITSNILLVKNSPEIHIETSCGIKKRTLKNTFLIKFQNCTMRIKERTYKNYEMTHVDNSYLLPLNNIQINESKFDASVNNYQLAKLTFKNREKLEEIINTEKETSKIYLALFGLGLATTIIITTIAGILYKNLTKAVTQTAVIKPMETIGRLLITPRLHSDKGGVMGTA